MFNVKTSVKQDISILFINKNSINANDTQAYQFRLGNSSAFNWHLKQKKELLTEWHTISCKTKFYEEGNILSE